MNRFGTRIVGVALALASTVVIAISPPPPAPVRPVVDDYFGTRITDNYRYFEERENADAAAWMKAQADYTRAVLDSLPGRAPLLRRIQELDRSVPMRVGGLQIVDGHYYTQRSPAMAQLPKLYVRDGLGGEDRLLLDPETLTGAGGAHVAMTGFAPSPDNRHVLYGLAEGGSEQPTLHVLDTASGQNLPETIDRSMFSFFTWQPDGRAFFYSRLQEFRPGMPETARFENGRIYRHELGRPLAEDRAIVGIGVSDARLPLRPTEIPLLLTSPDSRYAVAIVSPGTDARVRLYAAPLDQLDAEGGAPWRAIAASYDDGVVAADLDNYQSFGLRGDTLYVISRARSPAGEVLAIDLADPDLAKAQVVLAPGGLPIHDLVVGPDALWVVRMDAGVQQAQRLAFSEGATPAVIELPFAASVYDIIVDHGRGGAVLDVTSWTRMPTYLHYDAGSGRSAMDTSLRPASPGDQADGLEVTRVKVKSWDGVLVPLTIVHRKGLALDASHPAYLFGYGAYGITYTPFYDPVFGAMFERGFIMALAHVRGGGEYGEAWHQAGFQQTKPNTWKDFIACAQYLVAHGYTNPGKLAASGGSAGGIMIGRALEERPDLFAAVLDQVPVADMLRFETAANGPPNVPEYGSVKTEAGFRQLLEMSSYAQIEDGIHYPAVLVTTGANDPRVDAWIPAKFAARLQAATASGKPVLLRVDYDGGHGIGNTVGQALEEAADKLSFVLWQFGDPDFQPK